MDFKSVIIFTDGACTGNPGPGGWGSIIVTPQGVVTELGGPDPETTNNRMELLATIKALAHLNEIDDPDTTSHDIILYTDSTYVIRGITQWIWGWKSRGWKNASGQDVLNRDLWEELLRVTMRLKPKKINWKYVRGHTGVPGNERCDEIAVSFATKKWVELYRGPLIKYSLAIYDLPEDQELPAMKTYDKKPEAFSYLSNVGGLVFRHKTWAECERRVKGQSNAKFKKAKSEQEESEIIKSWGLDPKKSPIQE